MGRIIRWVGHPSPLYDHNILSRIKKGQMSPELVLKFEAFEHSRRIAPRRGVSSFSVGPRDGLSQQYQWGLRYYDVEMTEADWARLAKNPVQRYMFLDITNGPPPARPLLKPQEWMELMEAVDKTPAPQVILPPGRW